jgi:hypothetical protein
MVVENQAVGTEPRLHQSSDHVRGIGGQCVDNAQGALPLTELPSVAGARASRAARAEAQRRAQQRARLQELNREAAHLFAEMAKAMPPEALAEVTGIDVSAIYRMRKGSRAAQFRLVLGMFDGDDQSALRLLGMLAARRGFVVSRKPEVTRAAVAEKLLAIALRDGFFKWFAPTIAAAFNITIASLYDVLGVVTAEPEGVVG